MALGSLEASLAAALPLGYKFKLHHLSTPPTRCSALVAAPPGQTPEETYCETHFLSVSIDHDGKVLQVFAIEVLIYTTKHLTTLFVSKADSTGYLHLLQLPSRSPSPLRISAIVFLRYLVTHRLRSDRQLVLSLFARSQNQYLFPASVENSQKHILDDRGLIKWWCRVLDAVISEEQPHQLLPNGTIEQEPASSNSKKAKGYLRVPGYDAYETRTFFPRDGSGRSNAQGQWEVADPLRDLAVSPDLPERCLIPRFPDDPKGRFVDSLDEEIPEDVASESQTESQERTKPKHTGKWRSVRSLEQFWETMSFRQECSSGRLVGFLWAVFTPSTLNTAPQRQLTEDEKRELSAPNEGTGSLIPTPPSTQGLPEHPSQPASQENSTQSDTVAPEVTEYFYSPRESRGEVVLGQTAYEEAFRFLLELDYGNLAKAIDSTSKWIAEIALKASISTWGKAMQGETKVTEAVQPTANGNDGANMLGAGLIRKKKRPAGGDGSSTATVDGRVNDPCGNAVQKKSKTTIDSNQTA